MLQTYIFLLYHFIIIEQIYVACHVQMADACLYGSHLMVEESYCYYLALYSIVFVCDKLTMEGCVTITTLLIA